MDLAVDTHGQVRCLYTEAIELALLGSVTIARASHVEPDNDANWWADLCPVSGPKLGPFPCRSEALQAEAVWLNDHWLAKEVSHEPQELPFRPGQ